MVYIYMYCIYIYFFNEMPTVDAAAFYNGEENTAELGAGIWYPDVRILNKINEADLKK